MNWGYGHSIRPIKKETTSDIYIQTGEALTEEDAEQTIERISKLFDKEEQFQLLVGSVTILYGTINLRIQIFSGSFYTAEIKESSPDRRGSIPRLVAN